MKKHIITLAALGLLMSSCGIYTKYKPATEVPDNLYGAEVTDALSQSSADDSLGLGGLDWRELFTDPQLQALIEQGLQNNTDYQSAQLRVEEAEAALLSAKLAFLPSFALAPQGTVSSFDNHRATQTYSLPVAASWELDVFGRMRNAKKQAKALYAQSQDYRQAVHTQLIAGIANTYYTLLMLDEQLAISQQTEESWREIVSSTRALMNAGMSNESAVSQMEATYYQVQASVLDLKQQINQVENSLALLLAETPRSYERGSLSDQQFPEDFAVGIPVQMLARRPDVRMAERSLESAFYGTNAARSAFYPSITLSGSAGWTNSAGVMIVNPGKFVASAVGSLTQPLFARGQVIAQYRIARAQQEEAALGFQQALLNAGSEVNDALTAWQTSKEKTILLDKQVASLQTALHSTSLLMEHGNTTYLEVLTARQTLLSAQLSQTANRFAEIQSMISLYQALGGGQE
ncbi:TolC family protein [Bacteroides sp. GD17]|jgi:multidrug efflux system outer membrane protein|uniref:TolC family protein n=1 Tax=Bacteroides sp. GD17 TaxID=3139826 RepID=UPI0025E06C27|nr:TolC family protein [uncultured Bacteroides sp.]